MSMILRILRTKFYIIDDARYGSTSVVMGILIDSAGTSGCDQARLPS